jgi:hypothetical protein
LIKNGATYNASKEINIVQHTTNDDVVQEKASFDYTTTAADILTKPCPNQKLM